MWFILDLMVLYVLTLLTLLTTVTESKQDSLDFNLDGLEVFSDLARAFGDAAGHADKCEFTCPDAAEPRPRPGFKPKSNGCGTYGIKVEVDVVPGMTRCCDAHDICYDTCGSKRQLCDKEFRECLENLCRDMKGSQKEISVCKSSSNLIYSGAVTFGCDAFRTSQKNACVCPKQDSQYNSRKKSRNEL